VACSCSSNMRFLSGFRIRRLGVVGFVALAFAGSAFAYVCHPDRPGTRSLTIQGRVDGYSMTGSRVAIQLWAHGCERRISWNPISFATSQAGGPSGRRGRGSTNRVVRDGRVVVLRRGSVVPDRPDRLAVYDVRTRARLHNWPLPARADTLDVARGVALLSTANGVYAVRLSDGRSALIG